MAKKILALVLAVGTLGYMVAPAMAAHDVFVGNFHYVGFYGHVRTSEAWSGDTDITDADEVNITNDGATSTAGGIDAVNTDVVDVGESSEDSHDIAVVNASGAGFVGTSSSSGAYTGGDVIGDADDVTVNNGTTESHAWGFSLVNTSITRVR